MTMANPVAPLRIIVVRIALGTFLAAFSISSDIYMGQSLLLDSSESLTCTAASAPSCSYQCISL